MDLRAWSTVVAWLLLGLTGVEWIVLALSIGRDARWVDRGWPARLHAVPLVHSLSASAGCAALAAWLGGHVGLVVAGAAFILGAAALEARRWSWVSPDAREVRVVGLGFVAALGVAGAWAAVSSWSSGWPVGVLVGAVFGILYLGSALEMALRDDRAVFLYFDRPVPEARGGCASPAFFRSGAAIDALAVARGLSAPSTFGFADDLRGETVTWHPPADLLRTIDGLLLAIERGSASLGDGANVVADLRGLRDGLVAAEVRGARSCLIVRNVHGWCGLELERRKGYFGDLGPPRPPARA